MQKLCILLIVLISLVGNSQEIDIQGLLQPPPSIEAIEHTKAIAQKNECRLASGEIYKKQDAGFKACLEQEQIEKKRQSKAYPSKKSVFED